MGTRLPRGPRYGAGTGPVLGLAAGTRLALSSGMATGVQGVASLPDSRPAPEVPRCLETLRGFVRRSTVLGGCGLCRASLSQGHLHLVSPTTRRLVCVCPACAASYASKDDQSLRPVPRIAGELLDFHMTSRQWEALGLPVNLAFCYWSSLDAGPVALHPGRGGAIETRLPEEPWLEIVSDNPVLQKMAPDVEGLIVHREPTPGHPRPVYVVVPIDACYQLIGILRAYWQGDDGGDAVWTEIDGFLTKVRGL